MKNKRIFLTFIFCTLITFIFAEASNNYGTDQKKKRNINLYGHVYNSFTKAGIDATITIMNEDSTVLGKLKAKLNRHGDDASFKIAVPAEKRKYIFKLEHEDYLTKYVDYEVKNILRNMYFDIPPMYMQRKDPMKDLDQMLDEVTITATKIKIQYKGDTVVFNADAFNVPSGSMLDELIRQLPNTVLKDNGEIFVNGRKIDYLTLNGEKFFKGNNKIMLDNLPYYTVKNLKVYEKLTENDEWLGEQTEPKDYVMDVELKREYRQGWLGNVEIAGGTKDRYLGRLFGLRYTDHSRFTLFANLNNVNESRRPGNDGEWTPSNMPTGLSKRETIGADLYISDKDKRYIENAQALINWEDVENQSRVSSVTFSSGGDIYSRLQSASKRNNFEVRLSNDFTLNIPFKLKSNISAYYTKNDGNSFSRSSMFGADPSMYGNTVQILDSVFSIYGNSLKDMAINRTDNRSMYEREFFSLSGNLVYNKHLAWGDDFQIGADVKYDRRSVGKDFSNQMTEYMETGDIDYRNYFNKTPYWQYDYSAWASYTFNFLSRWKYKISLEYEQDCDNRLMDYYRLDRLGNGWNIYNMKDMGSLPYGNDSLAMAFDIDNSYSRNNLTRHYQFRNEVSFDKTADGKYTFLKIKMPLEYRHERMNFSSDALDTVARRKHLIFNPDIVYIKKRTDGSRQFQIHYSMNMTTPDFTDMVNIINTTDPLHTRLTNSELKKVQTHNLSATFMSRVDSIDQSLTLMGGVGLVLNNIATQTSYNSTKGAYTYRPANVDGNWGAGMDLSYNRALDRGKHFYISTNTSVRYYRDVDFDISYDDEPFSLSKVNNVYAKENLSIKYMFGNLTTSLLGNLEWHNASSKRNGFTNINSFDFNYGVAFKYKLPFDIYLSTDFKIFSRRGYDDRSMNTDDLVWNAMVSKSFLKGGRLTAKLEAFDLLHQLSSTYQSINAQGRTETWRSCLPNYIMLHLIYKININPKKQ